MNIDEDDKFLLIFLGALLLSMFLAQTGTLSLFLVLVIDIIVGVLIYLYCKPAKLYKKAEG